MVARVDGRSFTRLTKEVFKFEAPFDPVFRDQMVATVEHMKSIASLFATRSRPTKTNKFTKDRS